MNEVCEMHREPAVGKCQFCEGPICQRCVATLGTVCSGNCAEAKDRAKGFQISDQQKKKKENAERVVSLVKKVFLALVALVLVCIAFSTFVHFYRISLHPYAKIGWEFKPEGKRRPVVLEVRDKIMILLDGTKVKAINVLSGAVEWSVDVEEDWKELKIWDDLIFVQNYVEIRVYDTKGGEVWQKFLNPRRKYITADRDAVLLYSGETYKRKREYLHNPDTDVRTKVDLTEEEKKWKPIKRGEVIDRKAWQLRWHQHYLVAVSPETGEDSWVAKLPEDGRVGTYRADEGIGVYVMHDDKQRSWLVAFEPKNGERLWKKVLPEGAWGRAQIKDGVISCAGETLIRYSFDGEELPEMAKKNADLYSPYRFGMEIENGGAWKQGAIQNIGGTLYRMEEDKEIWRYSMPGGIVSYALLDDMIVAIGHATEEGGGASSERNDFFANVNIGANDEDDAGAKALNKLINSKLKINDWVMIGIVAASGEKKWQHDNIAELVVPYGNTAVVIDRRWGTSIKQFRPKDGKELYVRRYEDKYFFAPQLLEGQLVGYWYQDQLDNGPSLGIIALSLKDMQ